MIPEEKGEKALQDENLGGGGGCPITGTRLLFPFLNIWRFTNQMKQIMHIPNYKEESLWTEVLKNIFLKERNLYSI